MKPRVNPLVNHVSDHHSVANKLKHTRTAATLEASVLKPQKMKILPNTDDPM
jgi:hypothetical protein